MDSSRFYRWLVNSLGPARLPPTRKSTVTGRGIGYFLWSQPPETFVQREVDGLRRQGVKVRVFAQEGQPTPEAEVRPGRLSLRAWFLALSRPWTLLRLLRWVVVCPYHLEKSWSRDLIVLRDALWLASRVRELGLAHLHSPWANPCALVTLVAARLAGLSCSLEVRAHELNRVVLPRFLPTILPCFDGVVTNSQFNLGQLKRLGFPARLIYNGLDLEHYPELNRPLESCPQPFRILCVARLVDPKGLDTLLRACAILRERQIPFQCQLVGGCEEPIYTYTRVMLKRLHRSLALEEQVQFLGQQPLAQVLELYRQAHAFALPAQVARDGSHDVTPNCLFEAMAMALPVITTPIGAIPEQVGQSAWLIPPAEPQALADALEQLWRQPELRLRLGQSGRLRCLERFSQRRQALEWVEFFRRWPATTAEKSPSPKA